MGAWGYSILEDDAASDAYGDYMDLLNAGLSAEAIEAKVREGNAEPLSDDDTALSVELGIAKAQWECGHTTPASIGRLGRLIDSGAGMALWEDAGPKAAEKRRKVLATFFAKLQSPNPRPKKPRKPILRKPAMEPGTCLALLHPSGRYAAALVLLNPVERAGPGADAYGVNHVAYLDYFEPEPPSLAVFEQRRWLYRPAQIAPPPAWVIRCEATQVAFYRRADKSRLKVIGQIPPVAADAMMDAGTFTFEAPKHFPEQIAAWRAVRDDPATPRYANHRDLYLERFGEEGVKYMRRIEFDLSPLRAAAPKK